MWPFKKKRIYNVLLGGDKIGTTYLEKEDAPMGVVFGKIKFVNNNFDYKFFSEYCKQYGLKAEEHPDDKMISILDTPSIKVVSESGVEIKGIGIGISGMDSDGYYVTVLGVGYPFYEQEFPQHVKAYNERFKK